MLFSSLYKNVFIIIFLLFSSGINAAQPSSKTTQIVQVNKSYAPITIEQANSIAVDAYIYAYPLVIMEITKRVMTNVDKAGETAAPVNQFMNARKFPDATFTAVVRPNADTLYSTVWFDVSAEPLVLELPATNDRYYLMPMLDMWSDVFAAPGSRTTGNNKQIFMLANQSWQGDLPSGVNLIRSPTNNGWIIGRIKTNGAEDYSNVGQIQDQLKIVPLSAYGKEYKAPAGIINPAQDMSAPVAQVAKMQGEEFFRLFCEVLKNNPPHANDYPILEQMSRIGIVPGQEFKVSEPAILQAIAAAPKKAQDVLQSYFQFAGTMVNRWRINYTAIGTYGTYYLNRACIAYAGLGANATDDAIYPTTFVDASEKPYSSDKKYLLHFSEKQIPPVNGFWSLTMYNEKQFFAANPINRFAIGDRDKLNFNADGSLDIYIQRESPGKDNESNWLPTPKSGTFSMNLRLYWPKAAVLNQSWTPPEVTELK